MKNALILHGTNGSSKDNWFPWLAAQLKERGYSVWVPDLPGADTPIIERYTRFLMGPNYNKKPFHFGPGTVIIGHSSGAVAALGLLQALPAETTVGTVICVGAFKDTLGWDAHKNFFTPELEFFRIRRKARKIVYIASEDDPYCPMEHAGYLAVQTGGELKIIPHQKHFSIETMGDQYKKFPELLKSIPE
jgi:predicted alpha/beta hydrolase family esterase